MKADRGDTIIEVLFAVTIFCLVAVGGLSLMNQGTAMAQRSLEIGLVRAEMDSQADALRYIHNAYTAAAGQSGSTAKTVWDEVTAKHAVTEAQDFTVMAAGGTCHLPASNTGIAGSDGAPYAIDVRKLDGGTQENPVSPVLGLSQSDNVDSTATYAKINYYADDQHRIALNPAKPEGIWIQAVKVAAQANGVLGYYDFHIRACWFTPGQSTPMTLGTIVRLYDPGGNS